MISVDVYVDGQSHPFRILVTTNTTANDVIEYIKRRIADKSFARHNILCICTSRRTPLEVHDNRMRLLPPLKQLKSQGYTISMLITEPSDDRKHWQNDQADIAIKSNPNSTNIETPNFKAVFTDLPVCVEFELSEQVSGFDCNMVYDAIQNHKMKMLKPEANIRQAVRILRLQRTDHPVDVPILLSALEELYILQNKLFNLHPLKLEVVWSMYAKLRSFDKILSMLLYPPNFNNISDTMDSKTIAIVTDIFVTCAMNSACIADGYQVLSQYLLRHSTTIYLDHKQAVNRFIFNALTAVRLFLVAATTFGLRPSEMFILCRTLAQLGQLIYTVHKTRTGNRETNLSPISHAGTCPEIYSYFTTQESLVLLSASQVWGTRANVHKLNMHCCGEYLRNSKCFIEGIDEMLSEIDAAIFVHSFFLHRTNHSIGINRLGDWMSLLDGRIYNNLDYCGTVVHFDVSMMARTALFHSAQTEFSRLHGLHNGSCALSDLQLCFLLHPSDTLKWMVDAGSLSWTDDATHMVNDSNMSYTAIAVYCGFLYQFSDENDVLDKTVKTLHRDLDDDAPSWELSLIKRTITSHLRHSLYPSGVAATTAILMIFTSISLFDKRRRSWTINVKSPSPYLLRRCWIMRANQPSLSLTEARASPKQSVHLSRIPKKQLIRKSYTYEDATKLNQQHAYQLDQIPRLEFTKQLAGFSWAFGHLQPAGRAKLDDISVNTKIYNRSAHPFSMKFRNIAVISPTITGSEYVTSDACDFDLKPHITYCYPAVKGGPKYSGPQPVSRCPSSSNLMFARKPSFFTPKTVEHDEEFSLPSNLSAFAFPRGMKARKSPGRPRLTDFVLTGSDSELLFCCALTTYTRLSTFREQHSAVSLSDSSNQQYQLFRSCDTVYAPQALVVICNQDAFDLMHGVLRQLHRIAVSITEQIIREVTGVHPVTLRDVPASPLDLFGQHPLLNAISEYIVRDISKLSDSRVSFGFTLADIHYIFASAQFDHIPRLGDRGQLLFQCLHPDNIILLVVVMLMERRIVLCSRHTSILTPCAQTLKALIFPFEWIGSYISVLPTNLLEVLSMPTPYIIGVPMSAARLIKSVPEVDAIFVDLDRNDVHVCIQEKFPILPDSMKKRLSGILGCVARRLRNVPSKDHEALPSNCQSIEYESDSDDGLDSEDFSKNDYETETFESVDTNDELDEDMLSFGADRHVKLCQPRFREILVKGLSWPTQTAFIENRCPLDNIDIDVEGSLPLDFKSTHCADLRHTTDDIQIHVTNSQDDSANEGGMTPSTSRQKLLSKLCSNSWLCVKSQSTKTDDTERTVVSLVPKLDLGKLGSVHSNLTSGIAFSIDVSYSTEMKHNLFKLVQDSGFACVDTGVQYYNSKENEDTCHDTDRSPSVDLTHNGWSWKSCHQWYDPPSMMAAADDSMFANSVNFPHVNVLVAQRTFCDALTSLFLDYRKYFHIGKSNNATATSLPQRNADVMLSFNAKRYINEHTSLRSILVHVFQTQMWEQILRSFSNVAKLAIDDARNRFHIDSIHIRNRMDSTTEFRNSSNKVTESVVSADSSSIKSYTVVVNYGLSPEKQQQAKPPTDMDVPSDALLDSIESLKPYWHFLPDRIRLFDGIVTRKSKRTSRFRRGNHFLSKANTEAALDVATSELLQEHLIIPRMHIPGIWIKPAFSIAQCCMELLKKHESNGEILGKTYEALTSPATRTVLHNNSDASRSSLRMLNIFPSLSKTHFRSRSATTHIEIAEETNGNQIGQ